MPRIQMRDPFGTGFQIDSRNTDTLRAWFDEILPVCQITAGHDSETIWPSVMIHPMWALEPGEPHDPDWLCDSRVIGRFHEFRAVDGDTGIKALADLRRRLELELER